MRRVAFNFFAAISFLLLVVLIYSWVRSFLPAKMRFESVDGSLMILSWTGAIPTDPRSEEYDPNSGDKFVGIRTLVKMMSPPTETEWLGFRHISGGGIYHGVTFDIVAIPFWAIIPFAAILPALWLISRRRQRYRATTGRCLSCGYDLRESKDKCPECGTAIKVASVVALLLVMLCNGSWADENWHPSWPAEIQAKTWLATHSRLCFDVTEKTLDEVLKDGANVVCGGTNAAGIGFAGGPFILGENGQIIDILSGRPIPDETLKKLRARVDLAHARGAKVIGEVIRMHMTPWLQRAHPDWQVLNSPGEKPIAPEDVPKKHVLGCWNSPYGDFFIKTQVELVRRLDWDGYNMDGFGCWSHCFCKYCRESYKADTGREIPTTTNVNDSAFRHYLKWRLDRYTHFVARWTKALKEVKPDFVTAPWTTGPGRWWHWMGAPGAEGSDAMHRVLDAPFLELLWDFPPDQGSNLLPAFTCRYYRGLCGDRPAWILPYLCEQGQFNAQPPLAECELREMTVLANGCLAAQGHWQQSADASLSHFNQMIAQREPFTRDARSLKWAAMLVGESSRLLYGLTGRATEVPLGAWIGSGVDTPDIGKLAPGERRMPAHMESAVGVFRAMMEDHLPLDILIEPDVENPATLSQYRVLILPNSACISDKAAQTIGAFVRAGGGLVSFHESSLYDEFADRRQDFALAEVFGAHFKGKEDFSARWPNYPRTTEIYLGIAGADLHAISDDPVIRSNYRRGSDRLQYIGWMTNVEPAAGATKLGRRLAVPKEWPFIILNNPEKGRSVYIAADVGQAYFIAPYQYQRRLITNSVRWAAAGNGPPIAIDAPMCVQAAFYTQENPRRTLIHLLNELNTSANRAIPENNPSQREEIVPIHDIKITFSKDIKTAYQEPGHRLLQSKKMEGKAEVTVPELGVHSIIVVE